MSHLSWKINRSHSWSELIKIMTKLFAFILSKYKGKNHAGYNIIGKSLTKITELSQGFIH